jgi:hypothetical protein
MAATRLALDRRANYPKQGWPQLMPIAEFRHSLLALHRIGSAASVPSNHVTQGEICHQDGAIVAMTRRDDIRTHDIAFDRSDFDPVEHRVNRFLSKTSQVGALRRRHSSRFPACIQSAKSALGEAFSGVTSMIGRSLRTGSRFAISSSLSGFALSGRQYDQPQPACRPAHSARFC